MKFLFERVGMEIQFSAQDGIHYTYESYCVFMDITIFTYGSELEKRRILASKEVLEVLRDSIISLLENDSNEVNISMPESEENGFIYIAKPFILPTKKIFKEKGYTEDQIDSYFEPSKFFRIIVCLRGVLSGTAYMSQITREELQTLLLELDDVFSVVGHSDLYKVFNK